MKQKTRITLFATAFVLTMLLIDYGYRSRDVSIPVSVAMTESKRVYNSITVSGNLIAQNSMQLYVSGSAKVQETYVKIGDEVVEGEALWLIQECQNYEGLQASEVISAFGDLEEGGTTVTADVSDGSVVVYAERAGTVLKVPTAGKVIFPGIPYAKIADLSTLRARVDVPEAYARQIEVGQRANITVSAFSDEPLAGTVASVAACATQPVSLTGKSGTVSLTTELQILSSTTALKPGYSLSAKIFTDEKENAVVVPYDAVTQKGDKEIVYTVDENQCAHRTEVTTGYMLSDEIEIAQGAAAGETVILNPPETLQTGDPVRIVS